MTSLVERRARLVGGPGALEECRLLGIIRRPARPGLPHPDGRRLRRSWSRLDGIEVLWLCRRCRRCWRRSGCRRSDCRCDGHRRTVCWRSGSWVGWTLQGCRQLALWCCRCGGGGGRVCGVVVASGPIHGGGGGLFLLKERGQRCLHIVGRQRTCLRAAAIQPPKDVRARSCYTARAFAWAREVWAQQKNRDDLGHTCIQAAGLAPRRSGNGTRKFGALQLPELSVAHQTSLTPRHWTPRGLTAGAARR